MPCLPWVQQPVRYSIPWFLPKDAAAAKSLQPCLTLCNSIDISPPGSPDPGILQARTLQWVAISFSNAWKWKVKVKLLSHVWLLVTPWTEAYQAPPSVGFSRKEYWSGLPLPSPKDVCELWPSTTAKISEITMIIIGESKQISWFFHIQAPLTSYICIQWLCNGLMLSHWCMLSHFSRVQLLQPYRL